MNCCVRRQGSPSIGSTASALTADAIFGSSEPASALTSPASIVAFPPGAEATARITDPELGRAEIRVLIDGKPVSSCLTLASNIEDKQVTIRDRDTLEQERVPLAAVRDRLKALISG